jgi:anti-sigma regulatory factor (Ser/Thr protein kinase)
MIIMDKQAPKRQVISLQNRVSDSIKLSEFLRQYVKTFHIPDEIFNDLRLAIEETFINIASYAYDEQDSQNISIELNNADQEVSVTFTDTGIAFNPLTDASECSAGDDHCEGGMGIHLIKSLTDRQEYDRIGQSNVFTITKHYTR